MEVYSIGFTKKTAEQFFGLLKETGIRRLLDVRLNNVSQLAGFAKRDDLRFFLRTICEVEYIHEPLLAPTQEMLDAYKKRKGDWSVYEKQFLELMATRHIEETVPKDIVNEGCLLCSEDKPHHCHRRLVAEYLASHWPDVQINHL